MVSVINPSNIPLPADTGAFMQVELLEAIKKQENNELKTPLTKHYCCGVDPTPCNRSGSCEETSKAQKIINLNEENDSDRTDNANYIVLLIHSNTTKFLKSVQ